MKALQARAALAAALRSESGGRDHQSLRRLNGFIPKFGLAEARADALLAKVKDHGTWTFSDYAALVIATSDVMKSAPAWWSVILRTFSVHAP